MFDRPNHFKNETIELTKKSLHVPHHFKLQYNPWNNGRVERLGKELLPVFRAIMSEFRLSHEELPALLPLVQSAIKNALSPQCAGEPPALSMTGLKATLPISTFYGSKTQDVLTENELEKKRLTNVKELVNFVGALYHTIQQSLREGRLAGRKFTSREARQNFTDG